MGGLVVSEFHLMQFVMSLCPGCVIPKTIIKMEQTTGIREVAVQPNCTYVKGRVVCGTVYGDIQYKDLM